MEELQEHRLNEMGRGCTCGTMFCKKWQDNFNHTGNEKRCKRCFSLQSIREDEEGNRSWWCFNCFSGTQA